MAKAPKTANQKFEALLGTDTVQEMEALDAQGLKQTVVEANQAMAQVKAELDANPAYQDLKLRLKDVTSSKREVDKRQKGRIALALSLLESVAQEPTFVVFNAPTPRVGGTE